MQAGVVAATIAQAGVIGNQGGGGGGGQVTSKGLRHITLRPSRGKETRWWRVVVPISRKGYG